jgi:sphingolipid C9-methyltransferase
MSSQKPVITTSVSAFKNAPPAGIYDGNGSFSNIALAGVVLGVPYFVKRMLPFVNRGGWYTYWFFVVLLGLPVTVAYWTLMSMYGSRKNERVQLPGKNVEDYIVIHDPVLKAKYHGKEKIPMQEFYDAYFNQRIDIKGALLVNSLFDAC